jgi:hypothetical protein
MSLWQSNKAMEIDSFLQVCVLHFYVFPAGHDGLPTAGLC